MTTISGAGEQSAVNTWLAGTIAKKQQAAADSAAIPTAGTDTVTGVAVKPSAENWGDVILKLSPHMALVVAAGSWLHSNSAVIHAKANVEIAKLEQGIDSTADSATRYAMFDNAGAEGRDAYVQRELVRYDASQAARALYRQYKYAVEHNVSPATVDPAVVPEEMDSPVLKRPDAVVYFAHKALERQAMAWLRANTATINEKASVEAAKWEAGILTDDIHDLTTAYASFSKASAEEKEAYVQRKLIHFDVSRATYALHQQYQYAMDRNIPPSSVDPSVIPEDSSFMAVNGGKREQEEFRLRHTVERLSAGPITHNPANVARASTVAAVAASQPARKLITEQDVIDATHAQLLALRQKMGVAADTDYQTTYTNKGQLSTSEMTAFIQKEIMEAQRFADKWMPGVICGVAVPAQSSKADSADTSAAALPSRYKENHEMYLLNIAYLPLEMARKSLEFGEYLARSNALDDTHLHSGYRNQTISDINTYLAALKDHISKLENGGSLW